MIIDKLKKRGKIMVNRCFICRRAEESCNHIVLCCLFVYKFWTTMYGLLRINWEMANTVQDEIWALKGISSGKKHLDVILLAIFMVV